MITYGRSIEWNKGSGRTRLEVSECPSREEAFRSVLDWALDSGWRAPRWWQFWRWDEAFWQWTPEERAIARNAAAR